MKKILSEVFSFGSLLTGIIGISLGYVSVKLMDSVKKGSFYDFLIFIVTSTSVILCLFLLGYIMNKTVFKNKE